MTGVLSGAVMIVIGLVPGLFQGLAEGVQNLGSLLSARFPSPFQRRAEFRQPIGLAVLGAAWIGLSVVAYLSSY